MQRSELHYSRQDEDFDCKHGDGDGHDGGGVDDDDEHRGGGGHPGVRQPTACAGSGYTFVGIAQQVCAQFATPVGSVLVRNLASACQRGTAYRNGGCTTATLSGNGPAVQCFIGGAYIGAAWFNNCRRRKLQQAAAAATASCSHTATTPTGVHFTDASGSWLLHTPNANATAMLDLLRALEDAEKVEWLRSQGARFLTA